MNGIDTAALAGYAAAVTADPTDGEDRFADLHAAITDAVRHSPNF